MSTNFFRVRKFDVRINDELKSEENKEEKTEEKSILIQPKLLGLKVITQKDKRQFADWLNGEYNQSFMIVSENDETDTNPFHYSSSLTDNDVNHWEALQKAIEDMGLRETYCKGVYCQQHNPDMPAGDYSNQKHYVWNDATQEMVELPGIYYISEDGNQANGLEGYEEILAYAQGFRFTETDGVYTKDGKNYTFNVETLEFEEVIEEPKNPVDAVLDKYLTDEYDTTMNAKDAAPILLEMLQELIPVLQSEYGMTTDEIMELFQNEVNNNLMCRIGSDETFINISVFVENLKREIENFVENNKTGLEKLWDKYLTDENDKEVSFDALSPFLADLKATLMSEEYNYTEEQYNELIQKALIECPKDVTNKSGMISIKLNFKEFVSIVKNLIENPEEPEEPKNPVDAILDKYDTDEYDSLINVKDAAVTILEILNELSPVLQSEYGMTSSKINELFQTVYNNNLMCRIDCDETFICIRDFVKDLKEAIANFELTEPEEPEQEKRDIEKYLDGYILDEYDRDAANYSEAKEYIENFKNVIKNYLIEKLGYTEDYAQLLVTFTNNIYVNYTFPCNIKERLQEYKHCVVELTGSLNLDENMSQNGYINGEFLTNWQNYNSADPQSQFIAHVLIGFGEKGEITNKIYNNPQLKKIISNLIFEKINNILGNDTKKDNKGNVLLKLEDLQKLDFNNDGCYLEEFYEIVKSFYNDYYHTDNSSATTISADALFGEKDNLSAKDLYDLYNMMPFSSDLGVRNLYQVIENAIAKLDIYNIYDQVDYVKAIFTILSRKAGVQQTNPFSFTKEALEILNEQDVFAIIDEIIESDELKHEYYCGIDENIDNFGQGSTGDCWLLGGLISLSANEYGRQAIKDAINIEDNGNIKVKLYNSIELKWVSYEITPEELEFARKAPAYSHGDNDVLVMELAIEKLYNDMFWSRNDGKPGSSINGGTESGLIEMITGKNCPWVRNEDLEKLYPLVNNGDVVLTMDLGTGVSATTVDGEVFNWTAGEHAFGIVEMTEDTITIVNPWHSDIKYTFTFEEFKKLNPSVWAAKMTDGKSENLSYDKTSSSSFKIEGKEYTIESLLNSEKTTRSSFMPVVRGTQYWNEGYFDTTDVFNTIKTFIQTFANSLTNYDDYFMVQDAIQATTNYYCYAGMLRNNDSFEYYNNSTGEHETSYDQSCVVKSANYNEIQNGSVFEGKTSDTGIYSAYDAENDTWYVQIDYQKVLEKFLSFLK